MSVMMIYNLETVTWTPRTTPPPRPVLSFPRLIELVTAVKVCICFNYTCSPETVQLKTVTDRHSFTNGNLNTGVGACLLKLLTVGQN